LELAQIVDKAAQGGMGRCASAIDGGLRSGRVAILGFGGSATVEAPSHARYLHSQHFFDRASGAEFFPESFGEPGMFVSFFRLDTILSGEEAELEVIARRSSLTFGGDGTGGGECIAAVSLHLGNGYQG
jgi:hypothetical protein